MKYCRPECPKKVSQCPIVHKINTYNKRYSSKVIWCPKCNGEISGITELTHRLKYEGGLIQTAGLTAETKNYESLYACDCYAGEEQQKRGIAPYNFHLNGDSDKCFRQRKRDYFDRTNSRKAKKQSEIEVGIEN